MVSGSRAWDLSSSLKRSGGDEVRGSVRGQLLDGEVPEEDLNGLVLLLLPVSLEPLPGQGQRLPLRFRQLLTEVRRE